MLPPAKEMSRSIENPPPPDCDCEGLWYRIPTKVTQSAPFLFLKSHTPLQNAHIDHATDVAEIFPKSGVVDIYELTDKPGMFKAGYGRLKRYERLRLVGVWYRMQSVSTTISAFYDR